MVDDLELDGDECLGHVPVTALVVPLIIAPPTTLAKQLPID